MPVNFAKRIIYTAAAAVITAAAASAVCIFGSSPEKNAAASVYFTASADNAATERTEVTKNVSQLRKCVTDQKVIEAAAAEANVSADKLKAAVSVERIENLAAAQVILSGLEHPENAPIILGNLIYLAGQSEDSPQFKVITYCDYIDEPELPAVVIVSSAALAAALAAFLLMTFSPVRKDYYRTDKVSDDKDAFYEAITFLDYQAQAEKYSCSLGDLPPSAPQGLEKSGHTAAAAKILAKNSDKNPLFLAVAPSSNAVPAADSARMAAYLACAFAALGKHTCLIECNLREPCVADIFKASASGTLSDVISGICPVWDAVSVNARQGVDVIAENQAVRAPHHVLSMQSFSDIISYLSVQYDVMLFNAPLAWECEEWQHIISKCSGAVVVRKDGSDISGYCAKGIINSNIFTAMCNIKTVQTPQSAENEPSLTKG